MKEKFGYYCFKCNEFILEMPEYKTLQDSAMCVDCKSYNIMVCGLVKGECFVDMDDEICVQAKHHKDLLELIEIANKLTKKVIKNA